MIWFLDAFNLLSGSRSSNGMGPNHLSLTDVISLLTIKRPILDELLTVKVLQLMDSAYLNDFVDKRATKKEAEK